MNSNQIFIDTSALIALVIQNDQFHPQAKSLLAIFPQLTTSSWVIEEFVAHLHARYGYQVAKQGISFLKAIPGLQIEFLNSQMLDKIFALFNKYGSRRVTLVDISNVVIMESRNLDKIFAFDAQFATKFKLKLIP